MSELVGTPSDDVPAILAAGRTDVTTMFVSMSTRHPEGKDADYLLWHTFDHRPEQHRLAALRASMRLVSTPECRAARAAQTAPFDAVDHVMAYYFTDPESLRAFSSLSVALEDAGRKPYLLPAVDRRLYKIDGMAAAPRVKVGADVLPWWPALGVFVLVEEGRRTAAPLTEAAGVGGAWWGTELAIDVPGHDATTSGLSLSFCFLDGDPVSSALGLRPLLDERWRSGEVRPHLAAPFYALVAQDPLRHLPSTSGSAEASPPAVRARRRNATSDDGDSLAAP